MKTGLIVSSTANGTNGSMPTLNAKQTPKQEVIDMSYYEYLPENGNFTEDDLWEAIAESNGLDVSDIMDGDLAEWL